jgi:hypothetical protein
MIDLLKLLGAWLAGLLRSHAAREAELAFLRQQLVVLRRSAPSGLRLRTADRLIFVWLYRLLPSLLDAAVIFQPETRWCAGIAAASASTGVGSHDGPSDAREKVRILTGGSIAIMCPAIGCSVGYARDEACATACGAPCRS